MVALAAAEALLCSHEPGPDKPTVVFIDGLARLANKKLAVKLVLLGLLGCCKKSGAASNAY